MFNQCARLCIPALLAGYFFTSPLAAQAPAQGQGIMVYPAPGTVFVTADGVPVQAAPRNRPVQKALNCVGLGCLSDMNELGCGNLRTELRFIFGSCRSYFSQDCYPNPPHFGADGNGRKSCTSCGDW